MKKILNRFLRAAAAISVFALIGIVLLALPAAAQGEYQTIELSEYNLTIESAPVVTVTSPDGIVSTMIVIRETVTISSTLDIASDGTVGETVIVKGADLSSLHNEGNIKGLVYWTRLYGSRLSIKFLDKISDEALEENIQGKIADSNGEITISSWEFEEPAPELKLPFWGDGYSIAMGQSEDGLSHPVVRMSEPSKAREKAASIVIKSQAHSGISFSDRRSDSYIEEIEDAADLVSEKEIERQALWNPNNDDHGWNVFSMSSGDVSGDQASMEEKMKEELRLCGEILRGSSVMLS